MFQAIIQNVLDSPLKKLGTHSLPQVNNKTSFHLAKANFMLNNIKSIHKGLEILKYFINKD